MANENEQVVATKMEKVNLYVFPRKTQDGRTFTSYATKVKSGDFIDIHFTKDVEIPKQGCILYVRNDMINTSTDKRGNKIFWIKAIDHTEEIVREPEDLSDYFEEE